MGRSKRVKNFRVCFGPLVNEDTWSMDRSYDKRTREFAYSLDSWADCMLVNGPGGETRSGMIIHLYICSIRNRYSRGIVWDSAPVGWLAIPYSSDIFLSSTLLTCLFSGFPEFLSFSSPESAENFWGNELSPVLKLMVCALCGLRERLSAPLSLESSWK